MYCSVSGRVPQDPVVSKKTGYIYDRTIIEKLLESNGGKCPHTDADMTMDDLLTIRTILPMSFTNGNDPTGTADAPGKDDNTSNVVPSLTNIPSILKHIENEWDAKTIEIFQLRKSLEETRKRLASALYQLDASTRVNAKLQASGALSKRQDADKEGETKEETETLDQPRAVPEPENDVVEGDDVDGLSPNKANSQQPETELPKSEEDSIGAKLPEQWLNKARTLSFELLTARKARKVGEEWVKADDVAMMSVAAKYKFDYEQDGNVVTCVTIAGEDTAYVGFNNGWLNQIRIGNMCGVGEGLHAHPPTEGNGGVNSLWWGKSHPNRLVSGGSDGYVRVWDVGTNLNAVSNIDQRCEVLWVEQHPEGSLYLVGGTEHWTWVDLERNENLLRRRGDGLRYECFGLHPDGMMFAAGCADGMVQIWDVASSTCVERMGEKGSRVTDIAMSEKGYYMASCREGVIEVWDLRKCSVVGKVEVGAGAMMCNVSLDGMGEYGCAVGNGIACLFTGRKKAKAQTRIALGDNPNSLGEESRHGVCWGTNGAYVLVGASDSTLYKLSPDDQSEMK